MHLCDVDGWAADMHFLKFIVSYLCRGFLWFAVSHSGRPLSHLLLQTEPLVPLFIRTGIQ